ELNSPIDFYFAHGRSYGLHSTVGCWTYPPITSCGIWKAIPQDRRDTTFALITDVGNDILYNAQPEEIDRWVREAVLNLSPICSRIAITEIPLESVIGLGTVRFTLLRSIIFPKCRLNLKKVLDQAALLNELLKQTAKDSETLLLRPALDWYGVDPIHIKSAAKRVAWRNYIGRLVEGNRLHCDSENNEKLRLFLGLRPRSWRTFGLQRNAQQPDLVLCDGSQLHRY
ncbi:MAG: hypothetical protein KDB27_33205, partial [Planctomycetales bacterium]|nr:hypothetical protein [Planctomycetales bacterium]